MKKLYLPLLFILLSAPVFAAGDVISNVVNFIKQGDARQLAAFFADNIEVALPGDDKTYTKTDAEQALSVFFAKNPHARVSILHKVTSNPHYQYAVLAYTSGKTTYRINITLKPVNGSLRLI